MNTQPFHTDVSSKYGAPMGRNTRGTKLNGKVHLVRVRLDLGGYDQGGAYWGQGLPLFCAWSRDGALYVRAETRKDAKAKLLARTFEITDTGISFYR